MPFQIFLAAYLPSDTIRKNSHSDGANLVDCDRFCRIYLVSVRYFDLSAGAWHYRRHLLAAAVPLRQRLVFRQRTDAGEQYYGQFLALGLGFMILSPLDAAFGWRNVFIITGVIGIVVVVPLYITMLKNRKKRLIIVRRRQQSKLNLPWNRWAEPLPTPYFYLHHSRDVVLGNYVMDPHGCQFSRLYWIQ